MYNKSSKIVRYVSELSYITLAISIGLTIVAIVLIYRHGQSILVDRLRERLIAITSTASLQIDADDLSKIHTVEDLASEPAKRTLATLNRIRNVNKNVRYIYIWRKTDNPQFLEFVLDAEMSAPIDANGDGVIGDEEIPPVPGEPYDIDQIPNYVDIFDIPTAQSSFINDRWGTFMSGSAPIRNSEGHTIAVLGVDVEVSDFNQIVRAFSWPFISLAALLLVFLSAQTIVLILIWKARVKSVQDLDRQKDELLRLVSHQLAKPITAIKWSLESLVDGDSGPLNEKQKQSAQSLQTMAGEMSDLVAMILDVSRVQMGKVQLDPQPLALDVFFHELIALMKPLAERGNVHLVTDISPATLPTVLLDRRYARMVLENLLTNAIKYTPEQGCVTLKVRIEDGKLCASVTDTGCGIPKHEQSKIFSKMFRASNVRNTKEGNGFGLYIAKGAVEAQGGKLCFTSEVGKGTSFTVELPLAKTAA